MTRMPPPINECLKPVLTREHAQAAAQRMRKHDKTVTAYRCVPCGGWHVGGANGFKPAPPRTRSNHQLSNARP